MDMKLIHTSKIKCVLIEMLNGILNFYVYKCKIFFIMGRHLEEGRKKGKRQTERVSNQMNWTIRLIIINIFSA
jgi:hypothetical protein